MQENDIERERKEIEIEKNMVLCFLGLWEGVEMDWRWRGISSIIFHDMFHILFVGN